MISRHRQEVRHYARMFLGVERLPKGVPKLLDECFPRSIKRPIPMEAFAQVLRRYRRPSRFL